MSEFWRVRSKTRYWPSGVTSNPSKSSAGSPTFTEVTVQSSLAAGANRPALPFARSMMDGYALQAADTQGATAYNRLQLTIIGQALPGQPFAVVGV